MTSLTIHISRLNLPSQKSLWLLTASTETPGFWPKAALNILNAPIRLSGFTAYSNGIAYSSACLPFQNISSQFFIDSHMMCIVVINLFIIIHAPKTRNSVILPTYFHRCNLQSPSFPHDLQQMTVYTIDHVFN